MTTPRKTLWTPSTEFIENSNLRAFEAWLARNKDLSFHSYQELWQWSVEHTDTFWECLWRYFDIMSHSGYDQVLSSCRMPGMRWFQGATLNYAEHIFRKKTSKHPALYFKNEVNRVAAVGWRELEQQAASLRQQLSDWGVKKGDCAAGYLPNIPEALVSFLAVSALGAVWTCCSPDFGVNTVIDRFTQVKPKILIAANGYSYNGRQHLRHQEIDEINRGISSLEHIVLIDYENTKAAPAGEHTRWEECMDHPRARLEFEAVDFNHPIWVLYSSGTTGKPKAITHSHGGVLLEHLKYMYFHNDVKPRENFFWFTTTGWMMWNFLQASLLVGAIPVLYDGSPAYPSLDTLWKLAETLPIHHFGTSAPYLVACMKQKIKPKETRDLEQLRSIGSTGAPLPPEAFEWIYNDVKEDLWLCSMSGGTDVCTAFVGGCPAEPVHKGYIQCRALGCPLYAYSDEGQRIVGELGEMVIEKPMPSMPIYFWGDTNNESYLSSYFESYQGKWCHGDWINIDEDGQLMIQGRSDATLNRKGIRIGTAEIYAVLDKIEGISDSLIVTIEQPDGSDYMPLFVVLSDNNVVSATIKNKLRAQCSPRHVPDRIITVEDIPYTLSGKKMEIPVKKALMGMDISKSIHPDAVKNPKALAFFVELGAGGIRDLQH